MQCLLMVNWPPDRSHHTQGLIFDYIIIGAGSAGCVLASRLSEDARRRVLLVEAGDDPTLESVVPQYTFQMPGTVMDWQYKTENDGHSCQGAKDGRCAYPRGKGLGGSSSINGFIYLRGHPQNYDDLEIAGNVGWNYGTALKYFKKSENLTDPRVENDPDLSEYHNYSGPLGVSLFDGSNPIIPFIEKGYEELGIGPVVDPNGPPRHGISNIPVTVQSGKRASTAIAFLFPAKNRKNLIIFKKSLVTKIIFEGKTATGVVIRLDNGADIIAKATKEVIVSAGVVRTPHLLMLSGIGPRKHLQEFNIPVLADLAVGQNLHDHFTFPVFLTVNAGADDRTQNEIVYDVAEYVLFQKGFYAMTGLSHNPYIPLAAMIDVNNVSRESVTNMQIYFVNFGPNSAGLQGYCNFGANFKTEICDSMNSFNRDSQVLLVYLSLLVTNSRGNISLASTDPLVYPKIYTGFFNREDEIDMLLKGIDLVSKLVTTESFQALTATVRRIDIPACRRYDFPSRDYWSCAILNLASTEYHGMGTAKMGPQWDSTAVVDSNLRVYGFKNLRVVDASVIPDTISANNNPAVIMFAERASDLIKEAHRKC